MQGKMLVKKEFGVADMASPMMVINKFPRPSRRKSPPVCNPFVRGGAGNLFP